MKISYFLKLNEAGYGGHGDGVVHLGNSHTNWCFRLHVYPECGIQSLRDMMRYLKDKLGQFQDPDQEYPRIENQYVDVLPAVNGGDSRIFRRPHGASPPRASLAPSPDAE